MDPADLYTRPHPWQVNANHVQLYGTSTGAALINRIFIESSDARIVRGVTHVLQLSSPQIRDGVFYVGPSPSNAYTQVQSTLVPREIMSLNGGQDTLIPADGGTGSVGITLLSDSASAFAYARAFGYTGSELSPTSYSTYRTCSYLNGAVQAYTVFNAGQYAPRASSQPLADCVTDDTM